MTPIRYDMRSCGHAKSAFAHLRQHLYSFLAITTAAFVFMGGFAAEAVNPKYTAGVAAFNGKNFRAAVSAFGEVVRAEPRNLSAVYYLAMSYFSLGQISAAVGYFNWLAENYPGTIEGRRARSLIERLGAQAAVRGEKLGSRPSGSGGRSVSAPPAVARGDAAPKPVTSAPPSQISAESMIVMVKSIDDHPAVEESTVEAVKEALRGVQHNVLAFLYNHKVRVHIAATALDEDPTLAETQPRGYEEGATFRNVPAFFYRNNVVVCSYAFRAGRNDWEPIPDVEGAVRHEVGHALDHLLGELSNDNEFCNVYSYDCGKMEPEMQEKLQYYLQKGHAGRSECFAECCATIFGGRTYRRDRTEDVQASFPHSIHWVKVKLSQLY